MHNRSIWGGSEDKHTGIYSTDNSCSRFLFWILVSAEEPSLQRYVVENGNYVFIAFSGIIGIN